MLCQVSQGLVQDVYLRKEIVLLFDSLRPIFDRSKSQVIWKQLQVPSKEQMQWIALYQAGSHIITVPMACVLRHRSHALGVILNKQRLIPGCLE
jgi:hypothetical protein